MGSPVSAAGRPTDDIHVLILDAAHTPTLHGPGHLRLQSLQHLQVREILLWWWWWGGIQCGWRLAQTSPAEPLGSVSLVKGETTGVSQMRRHLPLKIILKNQNDYHFTTLEGNSPRNQP